MSSIIKFLKEQAYKQVSDEALTRGSLLEAADHNARVDQVFAELIVKACADAADMAYDEHCLYPGDYVGESLGYGVEDGISVWRYKLE